MPPSDLANEFEGVLSLYEPVEYGEHFHPGFGTDAIDVGNSLPSAIGEDWGIDVFDWNYLDDQKQCELLDEIRGVGRHRHNEEMETPSSDLWTPKDKRFTHVSEDELWFDFCDHIKHTRRFVFDTSAVGGMIADPRDWLPGLLSAVELNIFADQALFRARRHDGTVLSPYAADQMGPPPAAKTRGGRVNPAGIPVVYATLERDTAVYEVRPEKGARVTVAELRLKKNVTVVDLASLRTIPSPFGHAAEDLASLLTTNAFLGCVNDALSRPVRSGDAQIDYVPTQYIAEVIKNAKYDGIVYKSSLNKNGRNIVLFDAELVNVQTKTQLVEVASILLSFDPA